MGLDIVLGPTIYAVPVLCRALGLGLVLIHQSRFMILEKPGTIYDYIMLWHGICLSSDDLNVAASYFGPFVESKREM